VKGLETLPRGPTSRAVPDDAAPGDAGTRGWSPAAGAVAAGLLGVEPVAAGAAAVEPAVGGGVVVVVVGAVVDGEGVSDRASSSSVARRRSAQPSSNVERVIVFVSSVTAFDRLVRIRPCTVAPVPRTLAPSAIVVP